MHIVLGRFQPFHKGHAYLVEAALAKGDTTIAIGSSQAVSTMDNPWSADEREEMIRAWLDGREANIVQIPDINDLQTGLNTQQNFTAMVHWLPATRQKTLRGFRFPGRVGGFD